MLGQVALPSRVLDQDHFAGADDSALTVAGGYFDAGVEIDDVLAPWRRVPVDIVLGLGFAKDDAGRRQAFGQFAAVPFLDPFHFDVAEMRLAAGVGVEIVYAHRSPSSEKFRISRLPGGVMILCEIWLAEAFVHHTTDLGGAQSA